MRHVFLKSNQINKLVLGWRKSSVLDEVIYVRPDARNSWQHNVGIDVSNGRIDSRDAQSVVQRQRVQRRVREEEFQPEAAGQLPLKLSDKQ